MRPSVNGAAALRQEPFDQTTRRSQFASDDRGAQRQRIFARHFAEEFRASIKVLGVRNIALRIVAARSGENAIGADVNEARAGSTAKIRQSVRQERVGL